MKKIFTLLLFAGLVSSATFAQNHRNRQGQDNYPSGDNRNQSSAYPRDNNGGNSGAYDDNYGFGQTYKDHGWNNDNRHGYNQERSREGDYGYRNDDRDYQDGYPWYNHSRRMKHGRHGWGHNRFRVYFERHERW